MSVRTMTRVWDHSQHGGTNLLMLLAIADFADDNGHAYPSVSTLAAKCRTKPRYAIVLIEALSRSGELEVHKNKGPMGRGGRTNLYRIVLERLGKPAEAVHGGAVVHQGAVVNSGAVVKQGAVVHQGAESSEPGFREVVNPSAPKPSGNHQEPVVATRAKPTRAKPTHPIPEDWSPTDQLKAWARSARPDVDIDAIAENFRDHYLANGQARASWDASFRTWVKREDRFSGASRSGRGSAMNGSSEWMEGAL